MKLTTDQIEQSFRSTAGYKSFARAIESLVSQEYEKELARLKAACDAYSEAEMLCHTKDADRYRFMRDVDNGNVQIFPVATGFKFGQDISGIALDEFIDAAIKDQT